ncbi:MAG: amidophosphoribosyltransferase [Dialister sp.]|nr:amidophosphoribosyltransferase [Dialister sp.]
MVLDIDDKPHEECGVFGIFDRTVSAVYEAYYGIFALQHRGQESAGMTITDGTNMETFRGMGLVTEVFRDLPQKEGHIGIGHVRYSTTGSSIPANVQPLQASSIDGDIAIAHNGNLINTEHLRRRLLLEGSTFQTSMDTEVIIKLLARSRRSGMEEKVKELMDEIHGAYSLVACTGEALYGCRDPFGYRPLVLGKTESGWALASETAALDAISAEFVRDIRPGEIVTITDDGVRSAMYCDEASHPHGICSFEYIYFARPDSVMNGQDIYQARLDMGRRLWEETRYDGDVVMSVPDSGNVAALGYSQASGIPFAEGLLKNKYMGRTFIQPGQKNRERAVRMKLNPIRMNVKGKRIILVDDSIVRGTTSGIIIRLLRQAGAKEIMLCISSPPVRYPCFFGIDTAERKQLIAARYSLEDIRKSIGADKLHYLSEAGLADSISHIKQSDLCFACFNGRYPEPIMPGGLEKTDDEE